MSAPTLFATVTVHCFWAPKCNYVVEDIDPIAASDRMEAHYRAEHQGDIDGILQPGIHPNFGPKHAAKYAAKFAAETVLIGKPKTPTDANLMLHLRHCARAPRQAELQPIRDVFTEIYGVTQ